MSCHFESCYSKSLINSCDFCNRTFCIKHRLPEIHSLECSLILLAQYKVKYKTQSNQIKQLLDKRGNKHVDTILKNTTGLVAAVELEKQAAKKRLREKLKGMAEDRTRKETKVIKKK